MTIVGASLLSNPPQGGHIVYPYVHEDRAMDVVGLYTATGLKLGESAVLILTEEHQAQIEKYLQSEGIDLRRVEASGQLQLLNAQRLLDKFMDGAVVNATRFKIAIEPILARAKNFSHVRAYGEMVSLLFCQNHAAALRLEELWNEVLEGQPMCLLCTYDVSGQAALQKDLCATHSHYVV